MGLFKKKKDGDSSSGDSSRGSGQEDSHVYLNEMALGDGDEHWNQNSDELDDHFPEFSKSSDHTTLTIRDFLIFSPLMRFTYLVLFCCFLGIGLPMILDAILYDGPPGEASMLAGTCHVVEGLRTNCYPEGVEFDETMCVNKGCCYQPLNLDIGAPLCHHAIPSIHSLNLVSNQDYDAELNTFSYATAKDSWPLGKYNDSRIQVRQIKAGHTGILFYSESNMPDLGWGDSQEWEDESDLTISLENDSPEDARVQVKVDRASNGAFLMDSSYGSHIIGPHLSEVSFLLPSVALYGMGGHSLSFSGSRSYTTRTIYVSDSKNLADGHAHSFPTLLARDDHRRFFGLEVESQTPLTVEALPGLQNATTYMSEPLLVFRNMGGYLAFHIYSGPDALDVLAQMNIRDVDNIPLPPPVSSLGYHVCRRIGESGGLAQHFANMSNIPVDSDCIDEALLTSAFEINSEFDEDLVLLATTDISLAVQLPVQVSTSSASFDDGVYVMLANDSSIPATGLYQDDQVALPDFKAAGNDDWWSQGLAEVLGQLEDTLTAGNGSSELTAVHLIHNAAYLDEPDVYCNMSAIGYIPPEIEASLGGRSLCPNDQYIDGTLHLENNNDYPATSMETTSQALAGRPDLHLLSKHGSRMVDPSWGGLFGSQFEPSWDNMKMSLKEVLELGMAGMPLVSMTACGVQGSRTLNTSLVVDDLCLRWYQMAAYMPAMNSFYGTEENTRMPYDLAGSYRDWIQRALTHRLRLIPYIHTQLTESLARGMPLARPLFLEYPEDEKLHLIWEQFMLGDSILVSPVLDPGVTTLRSYVPFGTWYDLWSGQKLEGMADWRTMDDIPYQISATLRGGKTIPIMEHSSTSISATYATSRYSLISGLSCDVDPRGVLLICYSEGHLYLEQGVTVEFTVMSNSDDGSGHMTLTDGATGWSNCGNDLAEEPLPASQIGTVVIYGFKASPFQVVLADGTAMNVGTDYSDEVFYEEDTGRLQIAESGLDFCNDRRLEISWTF